MILISLSYLNDADLYPLTKLDCVSFGDGVLYSAAPEQYSIGEFKVAFYEYKNESGRYRKIYGFGLYGDY